MFRVSVEKLHSALKYNVEFPFGQILEMIAFKLKIAPTPLPMKFESSLWPYRFFQSQKNRQKDDLSIQTKFIYVNSLRTICLIYNQVLKKVTPEGVACSIASSCLALAAEANYHW